MMPALHSGLLPVPVRSSEDSDVGRDSTTFPLRPVLSRRRHRIRSGQTWISLRGPIKLCDGYP